MDSRKEELQEFKDKLQAEIPQDPERLKHQLEQKRTALKEQTKKELEQKKNQLKADLKRLMEQNKKEIQEKMKKQWKYLQDSTTAEDDRTIIYFWTIMALVSKKLLLLERDSGLRNPPSHCQSKEEGWKDDRQ
jgi:hypothetical protein